MENVNPILNYWLGLIILTIVGIGLIIDILIVSSYWGKWPKLFKKNLAAVPWVFRDILRICSGLIVIYFIVNLIGYSILKFNAAIAEQLKPIVNIICSIGMYGAGVWFIIHFLRVNYRIGLNSLGIKWFNWSRKSFKSGLFYLGFMPIMMLLTYIGLVLCNIFGIKPEPHPMVEILEKEKSLIFIYYIITTAVFIAPIFEEILFRGLFYQTLRKRLGFLKAAIISSCIFSLLHFNPSQFLPIMGLGTLFCFIFEYTGSLLPAIVLHIFNNGLFLGLFFLLKKYM